MDKEKFLEEFTGSSISWKDYAGFSAILLLAVPFLLGSIYGSSFRI